MELRIALGKNEEGGLVAFPAIAVEGKKGFIFLTPGSKSKEELFKELKSRLGLKKSDEFFALIPGSSSIT